MGILAWLVVGAIAGFLAEKVMHSSMGLMGNIVLGIVGGVLAGWVASAVLKVPNAMNEIDITSIAIAFVGAVVILWIGKMVRA